MAIEVEFGFAINQPATTASVRAKLICVLAYVERSELRKSAYVNTELTYSVQSANPMANQLYLCTCFCAVHTNCFW